MRERYLGDLISSVHYGNTPKPAQGAEVPRATLGEIPHAVRSNGHTVYSKPQGSPQELANSALKRRYDFDGYNANGPDVPVGCVARSLPSETTVPTMWSLSTRKHPWRW